MDSTQHEADDEMCIINAFCGHKCSLFHSLGRLTQVLRLATRSVSNGRFKIKRSLYAVAHPSDVCLSVTLVHFTQPVEIFGDVSTPLGTLAIR